MNTQRITCSCETCKVNARKVDAPFPLAADVPAVWAMPEGRAHGLIEVAHHPVLGSASVMADVTAVR
jgi:hypothetical protein